MKKLKHTYRLLAALTLAVCLGGCAQDDNILAPLGEESQEFKTTLVLRVGTPSSLTKADAPTTLSGTDAENAINRLDLFIVQENNQLIKTYSKAGSGLQSPVVFILDNNAINNADIYVAANMTQAQADAITTNNLNPETGITNITDIASETNGFLMTGVKKGVTIQKGEVTEASVTLDRVVSKVLLTCDTKDEAGIYVNLTNNENGYIKLSDVHYELANTNKKFYPFAKASNEDPNYNIDDELLGSLDANFFTESAESTESKGEALKYVESKVNTDNENRYVEGLYCLENTVNMNDFATAYENSFGIAKQVGTYVKISAKFTPAFIDDAGNLTEDEAKAKLTGGTFYTYKKAAEDKKHICYSSKAEGKKLNPGSTDTDFTEYAGGFLHYETFVASPSAFGEGSNLKRNNYYIMHITSMTAPIREKTIEVNTTVVGWAQKGKTVVDIDTTN